MKLAKLLEAYSALTPVPATALRAGNVIAAPDGGLWRVHHVTPTGRLSAIPLNNQLREVGDVTSLAASRIERQYIKAPRSKRRGLGSHADKGERYRDVRVPVLFKKITPAMIAMIRGAKAVKR